MHNKDQIFLEKAYELIISENFDWDSLKHKHSTDDYGMHRIDLFNNNGAVGYIEWDEDGEVNTIHIGDKLRRMGLGTHLWELATQLSEKAGWEPPQHSSRRTEAGDAFAQSIGGYIPRLTDDIDGWTTDRSI